MKYYNVAFKNYLDNNKFTSGPYIFKSDIDVKHGDYVAVHTRAGIALGRVLNEATDEDIECYCNTFECDAKQIIQVIDNNRIKETSDE